MQSTISHNLLQFSHVTDVDFSSRALELYRFQYRENLFYQQYCNLLHKNPGNVTCIFEIPFLPVEFFKTQQVITTVFEPKLVFESSGTGGDKSRHYIKEPQLYESSFLGSFQRFYGNPKDYCILGLLPSYLEAGNSSLVYMVQHLIAASQNDLSGFYLYNFDQLHSVLLQNEARAQKTILIGVTYALLDFAQAYAMPLKHTLVMETGGMKGRKKELTRKEVHDFLKGQWHLPAIHSEYGMTELLSQAYAKQDGIFEAPAWMKILCRNEDDPFEISDQAGSGALNIIDLANIYSCAFLATADVGKIFGDGRFEVLGRMDNADLRGCSLLTA
ncbi:MAG TPA: acyl transferase [Ferruginibacter sp.]|nr:acyl transferase [Ferruginibacter sp.]